ncbi:MAG TPA: flagellar biosynthetic protein FliO [Sphingomicrobium sp.]|jgi:flagellar biogenesis protein FliO
MDLLSLFRTMGALGVVLGMLAGALWIVRRYDIKLPGQMGGGPLRRLELIERLPIDGKRAMALIRRDGREHLILLGPEGPLMVETGIVPDWIDKKSESRRAEQKAARAVATEENSMTFREVLDRLAEKARRRREPAAETPDAAETTLPQDDLEKAA